MSRPAWAGRVEDLLDVENGAVLDGRVSRAVQRSDIGVAVRRSVVRGAQLADSLDARWDALSVALTRQQEQPREEEPKVPIDGDFASAVRRCASAALPAAQLEEARQKHAAFFEERSPGCTTAPLDDPRRITFETYASFRAYNALLTDSTAATRFESEYGRRLLDLVGGGEPLDVLRAFQAAGFVQHLTVNTVQDDEDDPRRRPLSVQLEGPLELPARLLLESQSRRLGLRVLPDACSTALRAYYAQKGLKPSLEEYFVDQKYRTKFDKDDYTAIQLEVVFDYPDSDDT